VGIVSYLTGIFNRDMFEKGPMAGNIFENYIITEIMKKELHRNSKARFYFLRTSHGGELDLIIDCRHT
jgi:predicted AAA+ superfamily ATPase